MVKKISPKKSIGYIILAVMLLFIARYISENPQILQKIKNIELWDFTVLSGFVIMVLLVNGFRARALTEIFTKSKLPFKEWFGLSIVNTLGNYSPMQGGFVARGYYLKNYYKVPYSHFTSSILASTIITFSTFSFVSALAVLTNYFFTKTFFVIPFLTFLFISFCGACTITFLPKIKRSNNKKNLFWKNLNSLMDGWEIISSDSRLIIRLIIIDLFSLTIIALRYYYAATTLNVGINIIQSIVIAAMAMVTQLVNITPGAIGIREAIAGFSATLVGASLSDGVLVAGLERAVILVWVTVIGIPFSIYFASHLNKKAPIINPRTHKG